MNRNLTLRYVNKRLISLIAPEHAVLSGTKDTLGSISLFGDNNSDATRIKTIGEPVTMASLSIPPKIPIYIRRGCIISIYNNNNPREGENSKISMTYERKNVFFNLLNYGSLASSVYHRLQSDQKFNMLVAPNFNSGILQRFSGNNFKTVSSLKLNGSSDWNIWGKDSIVGFEDNASLEVVPNRMLVLSLFKRNNIAYSKKFKTLKGRGSVLLSGLGSIYAVELKSENDEIIIKSEYLLGVSGCTQLDIKQSVSDEVLFDSNINEAKLRKKFGIAWVEIAPGTGVFKWNLFADYLRDLLVLGYDILRKQYRSIANRQEKFLRIKGPRNILIQTCRCVYSPTRVRKGEAFNAPVSERTVLTPDSEPNSEMRFNNIVTISGKGDVQFQSTPDFRETIEKLEKK